MIQKLLKVVRRGRSGAQIRVAPGPMMNLGRRGFVPPPPRPHAATDRS